MKISVDEIPQTPKEIDFSQSVEELNQIFSRESSRDFGVPSTLDVHLVYYRSESEIFFSGSFHGECIGVCGRCLEEYSFALDQDFEFVLIPDPRRSPRAAELHRDDLGLSFYSSDEIDVAPLINEQVMLALPTRPLCEEDCRGLCDSCGANLNRETCNCAQTGRDPRTAIFRTLKVDR
ncbi:MAG: DUF177 domain-containing protein [Deltaproteobacteria bacterium]|nr:DUF177 domain-containing protein [Deltaproteobacteria bacterium]